jgi:hypothetical protein
MVRTARVRRLKAGQPYGAQREMLLLSDRDAAGLPVRNPMPRAWLLWRIQGPLDVPAFTEALRQVAAEQDSWHTRFTPTGEGPRLVLADPTGPMPVAHLTPSADQVGLALSEILYAPMDLRGDPLARAALARLADGDHVLLVVADHATSDGMTLTSFLRRTVARYRHPTSALAEVPSFLAHTAAVATDEGRPASQRFWAEAVAAPVPEIRFPGGVWKPWPDCDATRATPFGFGDTLLADLREGTRRTGAPAAALLLAATSFLCGLWAEEPVPVLYARSGRSRREWLAVPGPLHEAVVSVAPAEVRQARTLSEWTRAHATANAASPPLLGQWLTDFGGLETLRERRRIVLNVQSRLRSFNLGSASIGPAGNAVPGGIPPPAGHPGFPARNALHLAVRWSAREVTMTVHHDPEVVPEPEPVLGALAEFARLLARSPEVATEHAAEELRERWHADRAAAGRA